MFDMKTPTCFIFLLLHMVLHCKSEEYNLVGEAGQAYSIEAYLGEPQKKLNLIVDTGSTTTAIAAYPRHGNDTYYDKCNSWLSLEYGKMIQAKYSEGMWTGELVSDIISFPSLPNIPVVRSDFAAITNSHEFFMNGAEWQGILGLAYPPIAAWGEDVKVGSWLEAVDGSLRKPVSFELELCGPESPSSPKHIGKMSMCVELGGCERKYYCTPILHKRWYEIGVLGVGVINFSLPNDTVCETKKYLDRVLGDNPPQRSMCQELNAEKSIMDSGTTNIRLPDKIYKQVLAQLRMKTEENGHNIFDGFWNNSEMACVSTPQNFEGLPWIWIDFLYDGNANAYFTLYIPPENYMRLVLAQYVEELKDWQYCYKLGLENGGKDTVLGYTAMEGLKVQFDRASDKICFDTSSCAASAMLSGPRYTRHSFIEDCGLHHVAPSILAAEWSLVAMSVIAISIITYLCAPYLKLTFWSLIKSLNRYSSRKHLLVEVEGY